MTLETFPYDPADYLIAPEDVVHFLEAELEEEDPAYWPGAIAIVARARGGFERLADESGLPVDFLREAADESTSTQREAVLKVIDAYRSRASAEPKAAEAIHAV